MSQQMIVARSVSSGPRRSVEQTCAAIAGLVADVLRERGYPDPARVRAQFDRIFPLLRYLLTTRRLAEPALTVTMAGLRMDIFVGYDPDFDEDLSVPNLVLLDSLTGRDQIQVSLHGVEQVDGRLGRLPAIASSRLLHFALLPGDYPPALPRRDSDDVTEPAAYLAEVPAPDHVRLADDRAGEEPGRAEPGPTDQAAAGQDVADQDADRDPALPTDVSAVDE